MDLASAEAEIRHVFGDTSIIEASIGAAPPHILAKLSDLYSQQQPKFAMASDLERELLVSDNETSPSIWAQPSVLPPSTTVSASLAMDASGTQQLFQQFVQILDNKLDHKLASFKRNIDDKDEHHASQFKKLKLEYKATSSFEFKGNNIQYEFNVACIDSLEKVSKCVLDGDLSKSSGELQQQISSLQKRNKLIRFADKSPAAWTAVDEYQSDDLTDDSEDKKKLRAAEPRELATIKLNKQSKKSSITKREVHPQRAPFEPPYTPPLQPFRGYHSFLPPCRGRRFRQQTNKCFSCGQYGHWAGSPICGSRRGTDFHQQGEAPASQN